MAKCFFFIPKLLEYLHPLLGLKRLYGRMSLKPNH